MTEAAASPHIMDSSDQAFMADVVEASNDQPVLVDFWAPWCGPCRMMAPEFSRAAGGLRENARLVKLNTEDFPQASQKHRIRGIPTMIAFQGGREVKRQSGAMRAPDIEGWIKG